MARQRQKKQTAPILTAEIERLSHEGRGITHIDGKTHFVFGALPGETVELQVTKKRSTYNEAVALNILTTSANRVTPLCPHYNVCGGCSLQHMNHSKQIEHKQAVLLELLEQQTHQKILDILPPITAEPWGYRRKARLGVKYVPKKEKVLVGFRERQAPYVTNMEVCHTLHPNVGQQIAALSDLMMTLECKDSVPQLEVALGDDETAIIVRHLKPFSESDLNKLVDFFKQRDWQLYLQPQGVDSIVRHPPAASTPDNHLYYALPHYQLRMAFHPTQFTQINTAVNRQMIDRALKLLALNANDHVLDLFCGIGNFSLPMAKHCDHLIGVEGDKSTVHQAQYNATQNHLDNTQFYTANLFESLDESAWAKQSFDKILIDPPRTGAQEVLAYVPQWKPKRILYISCNPATLARDVGILAQQGYHIRTAGIMDMFPHTQHVEAMVLLTHETDQSIIE